MWRNHYFVCIHVTVIELFLFPLTQTFFRSFGFICTHNYRPSIPKICNFRLYNTLLDKNSIHFFFSSSLPSSSEMCFLCVCVWVLACVTYVYWTFACTIFFTQYLSFCESILHSFVCTHWHFFISSSVHDKRLLHFQESFGPLFNSLFIIIKFSELAVFPSRSC